MNRRKNVANSVSINWMAKPYSVVWANEPSDIPEWDVSRGFPLTAGGAASYEMKVPYSLNELRYMLHLDIDGRFDEGPASAWTPLNAPTDGYPRLIRKDCSDISRGDYIPTKPIINDLSALIPYCYQLLHPAGKKMKKNIHQAIADLAEKYGAPYDLAHNSLFS